MKKCLLLIPLLLSGCGVNEISDIEKEPLLLFQKKVEMKTGTYNGILVHKKALGTKFICYYNYADPNDDSVSGYSVVKENCPGSVTIIRK